jgi:HSP20 family protein
MYGHCQAGSHIRYGSATNRFNQAPPFAWGFRRPKYNVPLNIVESDQQFEVYVYATGFSKENIKVTIVDDLLYISGKREIDEASKPNFSRQEFPIKTFERTLSLNGLVATENISAKVEDGVLVLNLPKIPQAPEQQVEVK